MQFSILVATKISVHYAKWKFSIWSTNNLRGLIKLVYKAQFPHVVFEFLDGALLLFEYALVTVGLPFKLLATCLKHYAH